MEKNISFNMYKINFSLIRNIKILTDKQIFNLIIKITRVNKNGFLSEIPIHTILFN
jgi:hypothetical protein